MKTRRRRWLMPAAWMLLLWGCGSGGGRGGWASDQFVFVPTRQVETILTSIAQDQDVTTASVRQARDDYQALRDDFPDDPRVAFGLALTGVATASAESLDELGVERAALEDARGWAAAPAAVLSAGARMINPVAPIDTLRDPARLLQPALPPLAHGAAGERGRQVVDDVPLADILEQIRSKLLPALGDAAALLAQAADDPAFVYELQFEDADGEAQTLTLRPLEARLLLGLVQLLKSTAHLLLVYELTGTDVEEPTVTELEIADGLLTQAEYFPAPPFAQRLADGAEQGGESLATMRAAVANLRQAWSGFAAANAVAGQSFVDLFGTDENSQPAFSEDEQADVTDGLAEIAAIWDGRYTITQSTLDRFGIELERPLVVTGVNLPAFWGNPPADLRTVFPTYQLVEDLGFEKQFAVGVYNEDAVGQWPESGGFVSLNGLIDPPVTQSAMRQQMLLSQWAIQEGEGLYTFF